MPDILLVDRQSRKSSHPSGTITLGAGEPQSYGATEGVTPLQTRVTGQDSGNGDNVLFDAAASRPRETQQPDAPYQAEEKLISP